MRNTNYERYQWCCSGAFFVKSKQIGRLPIVVLMNFEKMFLSKVNFLYYLRRFLL